MKIEKNINYEVSIKHEISYQPLSQYTNVSHFLEGENLFFIHHEISERKKGFYNDLNLKGKTTIVTKECLDELMQNPEQESEIIKKHATKYPVVLVDKEFIPAFKMSGLHYIYNYLKDFKESNVVDASKLISGKMIGDVNNTQRYEFIQSVPNEYHVQVFKRANGELLMTPFMFDNIKGHCNNEKYHLDLFVEHLAQRDDIMFVIEEGRYSKFNSRLLPCPLKGDEKDIGKIISDIPSYNQTEECTETITLLYLPKESDIEKILNWKTINTNKENYDIESFIVNDILGGKEFLNKPVVVQEPETPKRKFKK